MTWHETYEAMYRGADRALEVLPEQIAPVVHDAIRFWASVVQDDAPYLSDPRVQRHLVAAQYLLALPDAPVIIQEATDG